MPKIKPVEGRERRFQTRQCAAYDVGGFWGRRWCLGLVL